MDGEVSNKPVAQQIDQPSPWQLLYPQALTHYHKEKSLIPTENPHLPARAEWEEHDREQQKRPTDRADHLTIPKTDRQDFFVWTQTCLDAWLLLVPARDLLLQPETGCGRHLTSWRHAAHVERDFAHQKWATQSRLFARIHRSVVEYRLPSATAGLIATQTCWSVLFLQVCSRHVCDEQHQDEQRTFNLSVVQTQHRWHPTRDEEQWESERIGDGAYEFDVEVWWKGKRSAAVWNILRHQSGCRVQRENRQLQLYTLFLVSHSEL